MTMASQSFMQHYCGTTQGNTGVLFDGGHGDADGGAVAVAAIARAGGFDGRLLGGEDDAADGEDAGALRDGEQVGFFAGGGQGFDDLIGVADTDTVALAE